MYIYLNVLNVAAKCWFFNKNFEILFAKFIDELG